MPRRPTNIIFFTGASNLGPNSTDRRFTVVDMPTSRPKSAVVTRMSREPEFAQFLATIGHQVDDHEAIARAICAICEIDSRAALDSDPAALDRFESRIGLPYALYRWDNFLKKRSS